MVVVDEKVPLIGLVIPVIRNVAGDLIYQLGDGSMIQENIPLIGMVIPVTRDITGDLIYQSGGGGAGTVESVGLTAPSIFNVSGSPVTTTGTLAISLATQNANIGLFGPVSGAADVPTFRSLVEADLGIGVGTTGKFLRGDMAWSNNLLDTLIIGSGTTAQITFGGSSMLLLDGAADKVAIRNGVTPQSLYIYNTWTDGTIYERSIIGWNANIFTVGAENAGTGTSSRSLRLSSSVDIRFTLGGSDWWKINASGHFLAGGNNIQDIGSTADRIRTLYAGTSVVSPAFILNTRQDYTVTNSVATRIFDANATSIDELADVLGTLIGDLITAGLLQ